MRYYLKKPPAKLPRLLMDLKASPDIIKNRDQFLDFNQPGQREILLNDTIPRITKDMYEKGNYMYIDFQEKMFPGIKGFNHSAVRDQEDLDKNI